MEEKHSLRRIAAAEGALRLIGVICTIPLLYLGYQTFLDEGMFSAYSTLSIGSWGVVAFSMLFLVSVGLYVFVGRTFEIVFTLPALMMAVLPTYLHLVPHSTVVSSVSNSWQTFDGNMRDLMELIEGERVKGVPVLERHVIKYEYAMVRNGGFRTLTFSEWNGGIRAMTNDYLRGDTEKNFKLGGSFFTIGTERGNEPRCPNPTHVYHRYFSYNSNGATYEFANRCGPEVPHVFFRERLFPNIAVNQE